jgi:hypothetical protein
VIFFQFCDVLEVVIIHKTWLQTKDERRKEPKSFYILGYLVEFIIKNWQFGNFFFSKFGEFQSIFHGFFFCIGQNDIFQIKNW